MEAFMKLPDFSSPFPIRERETIVAIKGAVFLGVVTYFGDEISLILAAVAEFIK
jgi:hypothetical protein